MVSFDQIQEEYAPLVTLETTWVSDPDLISFDKLRSYINGWNLAKRHGKQEISDEESRWISNFGIEGLAVALQKIQNSICGVDREIEFATSGILDQKDRISDLNTTRLALERLRIEIAELRYGIHQVAPPIFPEVQNHFDSLFSGQTDDTPITNQLVVDAFIVTDIEAIKQYTKNTLLGIQEHKRFILDEEIHWLETYRNFYQKRMREIIIFYVSKHTEGIEINGHKQEPEDQADYSYICHNWSRLEKASTSVKSILYRHDTSP